MNHPLPLRRRRASAARERIVEAAYDLFARDGVICTGVDAVTERSGCAKMTLYRHFPSKEALVIDFLDERHRRWTSDWLMKRVEEGELAPEDRLLRIFDVFDVWFNSPEFEGCAFITTLLEHRQEGPINERSIAGLSDIRRFLQDLATQAGFAEVERFGRSWHMLMKGSIIAAHEGQRNAALEVKQVARVLLESWPRAPVS